MNKVLIFEGVGWEKADHNGVGNCRIRTRFENKDKEVIYFEMGGYIHNGEFKSHIYHCFNMKDVISNHSKELSYIEKLKPYYTKQAILNLINKELNCDF